MNTFVMCIFVIGMTNSQNFIKTVSHTVQYVFSFAYFK